MTRAYVISEVEAIDPAAFERYRALAAASIAAQGGRYLVRGGAAEAVEGGPPPRTMIVVEYPSLAQARKWYASAEYAEALRERQTALDRRLIFVDGVESPVEPIFGGFCLQMAASDRYIWGKSGAL